MPVGGVPGGEGPDDPLSGDAVTHMGVFDDVLMVIKGDKGMALYVPVHRQRQ